MRTLLDERITIMTKEEIAEILAKPYAQQLLNGPEPARMAYNGLDGDPRVIPIGFWTEGDRIVMATVPKSAKVAALRKNPKVALTIDQGAFPPKVLLIRGTAEVELVEEIPEGYLAAGHKVMTDDQYAGLGGRRARPLRRDGRHHDHPDLGQAPRLRNHHPQGSRRPHQGEVGRLTGDSRGQRCIAQIWTSGTKAFGVVGPVAGRTVTNARPIEVGSSWARRAYRWILPVAVFGSSSTTKSRRGRLNDAIRSRQCASTTSASTWRPERATTNATTSSRPWALRDTDDRRLEHVGMRDQHALDLGRRHPDPAGLDHVAVAPEERPVVVGGACVHVAGAQPAVMERRGRCLLAAPVAGRDRGTAHVEVPGRCRDR